MMFSKRKSDTSPVDALKEEISALTNSQKKFQELMEDDDWIVLKPSGDETMDIEDAMTNASPDEDKVSHRHKESLKSEAQERISQQDNGSMNSEENPMKTNAAPQVDIYRKTSESPNLLLVLWNGGPPDSSQLDDICHLVKKNLKTIIIMVFLLSVLATEASRGKHASVSLPQTTTDYEEVVNRLQKQVEELEATNLRYERDLSWFVRDRTNLRSLALRCKGELRAVSKSHAELEQEVKQNKSLVPVAFVTPASQQIHHPTLKVHNVSEIPKEEPDATLGRTCNALVVATSTAITTV
jgi:hypothetical protein